jgi:two-component system, LytTR family, response regulator
MTVSQFADAARRRIRVLVADDEPVARRRVTRLLKEDGDIDVIAECGGGLEAVDRIRSEMPDLVFLDIQMPDLDGIRVIEKVGVERMPPVVFVTAYNEYAIRAFDVNAVDYLLKPYDTARFRQALDRARDRLSRGDPSARVDELRSILRALVKQEGGRRADSTADGSPIPLNRIGVRIDGSLRIIRTADVDWFETEGNYMRLHVGRASHLIRTTAAELETQLDPREFVRIHRRYLVNLERVVEVQPWFAGDAIVVLRDGTKLRLSRTHREQFHARLLGDKG